MNIRERDVEDYLVKRVRSMGGEVRKVKWIGRVNAPDRRVMLYGGAWVEVKRPGKYATLAQAREHNRMRAKGERTVVVNTFAGVDALLKDICEGATHLRYIYS